MAAIVELLQAEGAATQPEMEAKISERGARRVQPHHLTTARQRLLDAGVIDRTAHRTRGGKLVTTYHLSAWPQKAAKRAAARKRLLHARFRSWSDTAEWRPAPIAALEMVVHASLLAAAPFGYRLVKPQGGEVGNLMGGPVPGGPLDNAAFYTGVEADGTTPLPVVVVPIEVKNLRGWIYPGTQELYQLLRKSTRLQLGHPDRRFFPVLVCRRMHPLLGRMAKQMGFYVISTWRQYLRPVLGVDPGDRRRFDEVNDELGYNLELHEGAVDAMVQHFVSSIPRKMSDYGGGRWHAVAHHPGVLPALEWLNQEPISTQDRRLAELELADAVEEATQEEATWAARPDEAEPDDDGWDAWE